MSVPYKISIEKDWIVVVSAGDKSLLSSKTMLVTPKVIATFFKTCRTILTN